VQYSEVFARIGSFRRARARRLACCVLWGLRCKSGSSAAVMVAASHWRPDPCYAMIHRGPTMVTAVLPGGRLQPDPTSAPTARLIVNIIGTITLLLGRDHRRAYDDIKNGLAYSTGEPDRYMMRTSGRPGGTRGHRCTAHPRLLQGGLFLGAGSGCTA